jgi:hypothetical protein
MRQGVTRCRNEHLLSSNSKIILLNSRRRVAIGVRKPVLFLLLTTVLTDRQ